MTAAEPAFNARTLTLTKPFESTSVVEEVMP